MWNLYSKKPEYYNNDKKDDILRLFEKCRDLEEVILPDGITEIATKAFAGCKKLKSIILPKSVKKIERDAFKYSGIEHIDLPESLEVIGDGAFVGSI